MSDFFSEPKSERPQGGGGRKVHEGGAPPLAERMRPGSLDEFVGQEEAVGPGSPLRRMVEGDALRSLVFWGPPGSGKTTLAAIIANSTHSRFVPMSAVTSSIKDVRAIMEQARLELAHTGRRTILFIDEIHRFNRAQQDAFLPFVEDGSIVLIGATTENPSFSLVSALLSRCAVFVLQGLSADNILHLLQRALMDKERGLGKLAPRVADGVLEKIAGIADGDARRALNLLELAVESAPLIDGTQPFIDKHALGQVLKRQTLLYDRAGEEHYNTISALHKAMRGSDAQGAAYWAQRMLASGEDPMYLARRMVRFASEDVGNADPQALVVALAAREAYDVLGTPEGELALLQCAIYLATAPKSIAVYAAQKRLQAEIEATGSLPVPLHIRNAPTGLMKNLGYGRDYQYDPATEGGVGGQDFLPDGVRERVFYEPGPYGFEREIAKRIEWWEKKRAEAKAGAEESGGVDGEEQGGGGASGGLRAQKKDAITKKRPRKPDAEAG